MPQRWVGSMVILLVGLMCMQTAISAVFEPPFRWIETWDERGSGGGGCTTTYGEVDSGQTFSTYRATVKTPFCTREFARTFEMAEGNRKVAFSATIGWEDIAPQNVITIGTFAAYIVSLL